MGEPGASITCQIDTTPFSVAVSENGVWSYKVENNLQDMTEHSLNFDQKSRNGQASTKKTIQFRTDTKHMQPLTLTYPVGNKIINTNSPIISGMGKAGATIEAKLSGKVYNKVVNPDGCWQIQAEALPEGSSFLNVVQKDMGNLSPAICADITVDSIAPSGPTVDFPKDQCSINNPTPVFCGKGEPNASINAIVDEKKYYAQVNAQGLWSFEVSEALMDDTHIVSTRQIDMAGNTSPEIVNVFSVKTMQPKPPVVTNPISGTIISEATPTLSGHGENDCAIVALVYDKAYDAFVSPNGSWEIKIAEKLADGTHTLKVYQVDKAGNLSPNVDITIKVDTTVPAAPVIVYPEKGKYVNNAKFAVRGTGEPDATVFCTAADKEYTTRVANDGSWSVDLTNNENIKYKMDYSISAMQIDLAGNASGIIKTEFCMDADRLKKVEIAYPENNTIINTVSPLITGTGKAGATVNVSLNNKNYTTAVLSNSTWTVKIDEELPQGMNTMSVTQTYCGNTSPTACVTFGIKLSTPPCPIVTAPTENQTVESRDIIIKGKGEADAQINIRLDDACYYTEVNKSGTWEYTVSGLLQGIHSILVSQSDTAGNESLCSGLRFVSHSSQPNLNHKSYPTSYEISYNPPGPDFKAHTIATLITSNPVTINNVLGNEFSMIIPANGLYNFNYTELGGSSGTVTAGVTWIDNQPPIIQIDPCGNYFSSDKIVSFYKYGGSCIKSALINNAPIKSGTRVSEEGKYSVVITDRAGNMAEKCFVIDRTPPDVLGVENNKVYKNDVTINYVDNLSGIKSAVLNGLNVLPGTVVTENGDYTLTITDFADNITEGYFKIQK